jgi:DNA-binding transcriptional MerR regulator
MKGQRTYRVRELAQISGVSIRTLHHYDEIGLLTPNARSQAGYRLYSEDDLIRLQQILIGRELGLSLEAIRRSLDDPRFDRRKTLIEQRGLLKKRVLQTEAMIKAVDAALAILDGKDTGGTMDMKKLFGGFDPAEYAEEARQRWGHTDAYKESAKRTARYKVEDWEAIKAEQAGIYGDLNTALKAGKKPEDADVMDIAERHRLSIDRWFYPCSRQFHCGLASLYETDHRFAENIDKHGKGLTAFLTAAIRANAER